VQSPAQAQPREVHIWGHKSQSAWVLSLYERHRRKSRQDQSHPPDAASAKQERSLEGNRWNSSLEQIHNKASRVKPPILHCAKGLHKNGMGSRTIESL
jgi:hypothetical protein